MEARSAHELDVHAQEAESETARMPGEVFQGAMLAGVVLSK